MNHFTPTYGAGETARNIRAFINENKQVFWNIFNPLLPYIIVLILFDFIITAVFFAESKNGFGLGSLIANYFYAALIISWHRVVIHGPDKYVPVNPFKPRKSELAFMGMAILLPFGIMLAAGILITVFFFLGPIGITIGAIGGITLVVYLSYKVCFYFPAKAVNASITLKQSFAMTRGYFWKMMGAGFFASWRMTLLMFLYYMGAGLLAVGIFAVVQAAFAMHVVAFAISLPVLVYFQPILTVIGVTVLSNYYLHAIQNRSGS